ncbi:MAG: hypothetical protein WA160_13605 [Pseudobdellovibrio sp.]
MKLVIITGLLLSSVCFANRESGGREGASAIYVDFKSIGSGIDTVSAETFAKLSSEALENGNVVDSTAEQIGREGESLYCIKLTNANLRYEFIKALAVPIIADRQATGVQRTAVYVGMECHSFETATEQDITRN